VTLLKKEYEVTPTAAASKFLWILHQSPVVIYDSRALTCLRWFTRKKITERAYAEYRYEWLQQFDGRRVAISSACDELLRIKDFAPSTSDETELESVVKSPWFHGRVFDKFLWWNGRSEEAPE
jgi:hypothetical protein